MHVINVQSADISNSSLSVFMQKAKEEKLINE